jgi:hypothetical protein
VSDETETLTSRDFIYAGRRMLTGGRVGHCIIPIGDNGEFMEERYYQLTTKYKAIIGAVYTGAEFGETKSIGVNVAKFQKVRHDPEKIDWIAEDRLVDIELATKRLLGDARRINEIDTAMLPIRKRLAAARSRGDISTALAIRQAVIASLERPPTKAEE